MAYQGMGGGNGLRSPREESSFLSLNRAAQNQNGDGRATLQRRFTTNNIPTMSTPLSPIGQQRRQAAEPTEFTTAVCGHSRTSKRRTSSVGAPRRFAHWYSAAVATMSERRETESFSSAAC
ncbi:mRNA binding protein Pumilio 2 [Alternaria alternata]|nr:mRNA binding protein Pumilio 2 [Alternaria alternata]